VKSKLAILALVVPAIVALLGYFATADFREREAVLNPLRASRAPLNAVIAEAGAFTIIRRDTPLWIQLLAQYRAGSAWDRHIAIKMERASAVGHTSTMWMQTWIFLDDADRLTDFELGTQ
jgi:hypothetical protein